MTQSESIAYNRYVALADALLEHSKKGKGSDHIILPPPCPVALKKLNECDRINLVPVHCGCMHQEYNNVYRIEYLTKSP